MKTNDNILGQFDNSIEISEKPKKLKQAKGKKEKLTVLDVPRRSSLVTSNPETSSNRPETCIEVADEDDIESKVFKLSHVDNFLIESPIANKAVVDSLEQISCIDQEVKELSHLAELSNEGDSQELLKEDEVSKGAGEMLGETSEAEPRQSALVEHLGERVPIELVCLTTFK